LRSSPTEFGRATASLDTEPNIIEEDACYIKTCGGGAAVIKGSAGLADTVPLGGVGAFFVLLIGC
jgi:hypothetical protein